MIKSQSIILIVNRRRLQTIVSIIVWRRLKFKQDRLNDFCRFSFTDPANWSEPIFWSFSVPVYCECLNDEN